MNVVERSSLVKSREVPSKSAATEKSSAAALIAMLLPDVEYLPRDPDWEATESRIAAHAAKHVPPFEQ